MGRILSGKKIAQFLGATSPTTTCNAVLTPSAMPSASPLCAPAGSGPEKPIQCNTGSIRVATASSVTAPRPRLAMVMPSWQVERYRSSLCLISSASRASRLVLAATSSRDARAPTAANSAATKYPFSSTSAIVARIFQTMSTVRAFVPASLPLHNETDEPPSAPRAPRNKTGMIHRLLGALGALGGFNELPPSRPCSALLKSFAIYPHFRHNGGRGCIPPAQV